MDSSVVDAGRAEEECETADRKRNLQDLLRQEMDMHLTGRHEETHISLSDDDGDDDDDDDVRGQGQHPKESGESEWYHTAERGDQADHEKLLERRTRLRETHERLIENELMKMERELQEEQMAGVEGEMSYLRRERHILVLQMEALRRENQQVYADLENQKRQHQQQISNLREESLQVFRVFREVLEEQRCKSERRYRDLLLDAIQDAVHLSSQNLQLQKALNPTP
ncbi:trichohyalin-like [Sinocyclocheilus rhinocerous]|uniref:trichohyalin-like n=1 Tax=Sinocyclocheilus rhinocerous TaxID=307959 RepID=UPI0007B916BE|nr:PREDICTED: trichohyalin-like [Sinocyclocheilus rhinocerous]